MHYVTVHLLFCWAHEKTSLRARMLLSRNRQPTARMTPLTPQVHRLRLRLSGKCCRHGDQGHGA